MKTKTFNDISQRNKKDFCELMEQSIKTRDSLSTFYDKVFVSALDKFDGKVLNKRFKTYLEQEAKRHFSSMGANFRYWFNNPEFRSDTKGNYYEIILNADVYTRKFAYQKEYIYLCLRYDEDGRINKANTLNDPLFKTWKSNFDKSTSEAEDCISNFDDFAKKAFSLYEAIEDFNKLPYYFRYNLRTSYFKTYTGQ